MSEYAMCITCGGKMKPNGETIKWGDNEAKVLECPDCGYRTTCTALSFEVGDDL